MANKWTAEQLNAITEKNGNILVSAAAGSGKTAVLVERIIRLITDKTEPVDIDRLLVVTFTKAAASEMKERIGDAIARELTEKPEQMNLRRQSVLLNHADITTIHSFCLRVARENYNRLGIDPAFRVADDTETLLIEDEVLNELFEEKYASDNPEAFLYMVENYSEGMSDSKLKELVLKIYNFIRSYPNFDSWIFNQKQAYCNNEKMNAWFDMLSEYACEYVNGALEVTKTALEIAEMFGPETYIPMLKSDIEKYISILSLKNDGVEKLFSAVKNMTYDTLSRKKCESEAKEKVKYLRDRAKKLIGYANETLIFDELNNMKDGIFKAGYGICALLDLVGEFAIRFDEEKKERRIADYSDLEHYCLKALLNESSTEDKPVKSLAAKELSEKYIYVMTDEYQDSNAVQELILSLVSSDKNRFMVGDVKQSIYSFRLADPDIFAEKYNTYLIEKDADNERIDMFKNFRSRGEILNCINFFFMQLMQKDLGGISYDKNAMLYIGADFPEYIGEADAGGAVEVDCVFTDVADDEDEDIESLSGIEKEMNFVADRINGLMYGKDRLEVYDGKLEDYRALRYSDIAIVMRNMTHGADFIEVLRQKCIPATADANAVFLETTEVMIALSFLRVIDNSRQDIPLASVLRSPVYGFTADELLTVRLESKCEDYWDSVVFYAENGANSTIKQRLLSFIKQLNKWRDISVECTINELIWSVYTDTGFYDLVGVMPDGKARQANLLKLVKKASDYDSLSFKGLFDFIRYIEKINKNNVTMDSEASGETGDSVKLMTIHKSKGLEFPVVFLSGTATKFNKRDLNSNVVIHKKLGIGSEYTDMDIRVKYNTVPRVVITEAALHDLISEEIRILYVAMTRAKEKLIITGNAKYSKTRIARWDMFNGRKEVELPSFEITRADNYLDWIMMSLSRHRSGEKICEFSDTLPKNTGNGVFDYDADFEVNFIYEKSEMPEVKQDDIFTQINSEEDAEFLREQINARLSWEYPYTKETEIPGSVTVSDIKKIRGEKYPYTVKTPKFYSDKKGLSAAEIGTAVHKVIEHMDFNRRYEYSDIEELIEKCADLGLLTEQEKKAVSIKKIELFAQSHLYKRIMSADAVYKEEAFTIAISPEDIYNLQEYGNIDESVILHGRIDCYFIENGEAVLLDYKTDYFDEEEKLSEKYAVQMELYTKAVERVTGIRVKECYIYSISAGKTIRIKQY
ncbi:MAG: helicase-exonuclease AddAB subunit AddA [Candidatus Metalachnospira sp.]|nr:helicase-exonuclease AddAB subunit AddA [Candidatus Metalachnospira sp.]